MEGAGLEGGGLGELPEEGRATGGRAGRESTGRGTRMQSISEKEVATLHS